MDGPFLFLLFTAVLAKSSGIYVTNKTSVSKYNDNPAYWTETGVWGPMLEEWATSNHREKRVMKFTPPSPNEYVTIVRADKIVEEKESKISPGKIVNSSYGPSGGVPVKKPPGRQVSETDLYLLGAIEKLVYRVDFMEKRLRRVEEMLYFVMAGNRIDQEPCAANFTRAGSNCYLFASNAGREFDWKAANKQCRKIGAVLAEMETIEENQDVVTYIQSNTFLRGKDFWTGGLNPGLLWIWSNSARPVATAQSNSNVKNPIANISGEGRCLRLGYDPALRSYAYKGTDCSVRYNYICELPDNKSTNEIRRIGRERDVFSSDEL